MMQIPGKAVIINIFSQFLALLCKELLFRKFHYIGSSFQVIFPIIIASIPCMVYNSLIEIKWEHRSEFKWVDFKTYLPIDVKEIEEYVSTNNMEFVYAPSNQVTDDLMEDSLQEFFRGNRYEVKIPKGMNSEDELKKYILEEQKMDEQKLMIGTVFKDFGNALPKDLNYKIYYNDRFKTERKYVLNSPDTYVEYEKTFFLRWQAAVGDTFIKKKSMELDRQIDYKIFMQRFPYPGHKENPGNLVYPSDMDLYIHLGILIFAAAIVKRIIEEKNDGSKELMESMGTTKYQYFSITFTNNFIMAFIFSLVIITIYKTSLKNTFFHVQSDFMLLFIILLLSMANLILFCMAFSIFFNKVAFAIITVMIVYLLSHRHLIWTITMDTSLEKYFSLSLFHKLCICLYPSGALLTSLLIVQVFESGNEGVQWRNLTEYTTVPDINMLMVMAMMVFSCFFYIIAIWYFDAVWPWQPGVRKPFHFFFMRSYWFGEATVVPDEIELERSENAVDNFEEEHRSAVKSVVIKSLRKTIRQGSSSKVVLHDLSLRCYEGQITTLVGPSEAGKTSLISILAGKELPTSGSVSISGMNIFTSKTRKLLGLCPQHTVLYEELSVQQHLKLYAAMKGTSLRQLTNEANQVLTSLKLSSQRNAMVSDLSYADKRKLNLAIAIVGGSKVLLLDEPTRGMDAGEKRHVWDALQAIKHDRTVIVTTQSFEEADILGDRIAVMAEGEIKTCGTPAFIKQKLGAGYHLHILKDVNFNLEGLKSLIAKHVSTVTCENESVKEVSFNLGSANELGILFEELNNCKADLGIISYGVSFSTIRDVLLTVSNMSQTKQTLPHGGATENTSTEAEDVSRDSFHPTLHASLNHQFRALLLKHFHLCKRRWKFQIIQIAVPFILMLMCFYLIYTTGETRYQPLELDISSVYGTTDGFYYNNDPSLSNLAESFKSVLESNDVSAEKISEPTHYVLNYGKKDLAKYLKRLVVGGAIDRFPSGTLNLTAWHNLGSVHSMPMSLLLMQNTLLRHITNTGSISLAIEPVMPLTQKYDSAFLYASVWWAQYFVPLIFTFLSLSFVLVPTHEMATKAKLLQMMSGIPAAMYWLSVFLWDALIYFIICNFLIMVPAFFFPSVFFGRQSDAIGPLLLLFFLYGWASLPLGYLVSILLKRENRGLFIFMGFCVLFGVVTLGITENISQYLIMRDRSPPYGLLDAYWFFRLFPLFSISEGININFQIAFHNAACNIFTLEDLTRCKSDLTSSSPTLLRCCKDICHDILDSGRYYEVCHKNLKQLSLKEKNNNNLSNGRDALFLGLEGIIFFAILFLLETRTAAEILNIIKFHLQSMWNQINRVVLRRGHRVLRNEVITEDPQVLQEEERIRNLIERQQGSVGEALVVLGLTKKCCTFSIVDRLTFGVNGEECFGILGVNGSGKTSIFRMLTGDDMLSGGNAFIQSYSLMGNFTKYCSHIGYCPEVDALMDDLTGREMLLLFGRLRGLLGYDLQKNVSELILNMGLTNCADEPTQFYSGGDKRKLSVAIALVGSPPVIMLDEPTARGSPESRRQIWTALTRARKRTGAAILLATQSMEESEAFCNRLAIMAKGRFRSLGSAEQLKSKHGQGYVLTIKTGKAHWQNAETVNALKNHIQNSLKNATLTDDYQGKLQYQVMDASMTVGQLFKFMSDVKKQFELEDYSIGAISLEQIFHVCARA